MKGGSVVNPASHAGGQGFESCRFPSKNDLLVESIGEAFQETARWLIEVGEQAPARSAIRGGGRGHSSEAGFQACRLARTGEASVTMTVSGKWSPL